MENRKIRQITLMGVLTAIIFTAQVVMGFLPNIELVSLLVILYTLIFGKLVFPILAVFILLEGILYGFGLWWINYTYIWALLAGIVLIFRKQQSPLFWSILSGAYGLAFGVLCALPYFFIGGPSAAFSYWISSIPFDIPHCIGNFTLCLVLYKPLRRILETSVIREGFSCCQPQFAKQIMKAQK